MTCILLLLTESLLKEHHGSELFFLRQLQYKILAESVDDFNISTL